MKTHVNMVKGRGPSQVNGQQVAFELKQRVVIALNKLADRDTYRLGVGELEKIIECLTPDAVAPFLSCILDTDSGQKSAVRKESIRLMGTLANFHESIVVPHLGKMVASIVKRLKDSDTVVRDACVDTVGVLASKMSSVAGDNENDGAFVVLVRPIFEALGEQNKQVQTGSALCLARVIDSIQNPPAIILQKMLAKTVKLLKNPHFMAKPAVIELNRSIIQSGGASKRSALSTAMTSIQEGLKNSDWATRKAACAALGDIASVGGAFFSAFRSSSIRTLESCRFDKVKPVRESALQALHMWKRLPGAGASEPSEVGSSIKENLYKDDYGDITRASESTVKDVTPMKFGCDTVRNKLRLSLRKAGHNHVEKPQRSGADEWHVEIAVPKTRKIFMSEVRDEESEGSSVTKAFEKGAETRNSHDVEYEYVHIDDKQECSSGSNLFPDNFHGKEVVGSHEVIAPLGASRRSAVEEISIEEQRYLSGMQDQRSLDSTVTELSSPKLHGCCSHIAKEMKYVRKQLLDIENKQSNLLDLLKEFTSNIVDNLSKIQIKVSGLEGMVDRMTKELSHGGKFPDPATTKFMKRSPAFVSPRLSTYTPRPSVDIPHRKSPLLTTKDVEVRGDRTLVKSRSRSFRNQNLDMWIDPAAKEGGYPIGNGIHQNNGQGTYGGQLRRNKDVFGRICTTNDKQNHLDAKNNLWGVVKGHLLARDVNSAYVEALYSGDELVLFELIDTTGPVLENLSQKTASDLLATLASYYFEQTYVNSITPWLQQVVELSSVQGPDYIVLPTNAKREFLSAFQESVKGGYSAPAERKSLMQLAMTLNQIWGKNEP
ncbi:TORTIFOLIA1-like protein 2 [Capsicum annuum]|uniref:TORTIFOLIA1-like protein 2 n=1 Tax=Capsicum annuum TaxID=4072 RepID=UPI001FB0ACAB|nr:TORTIFOLIA1-like protein 2 [Capsicum annuum]XP_016580234.2 TORTIFOLIA1-like protein 2 [Capsicum annuum]